MQSDPRKINIGWYVLGVCGDRHGCTTSLYDFSIDDRKGLICSFRPECSKRGPIWSRKNDEPTGTIVAGDSYSILNFTYACPSASSIKRSTWSSVNRCISFRASVAILGLEYVWKTRWTWSWRGNLCISESVNWHKAWDSREKSKSALTTGVSNS